MRKPRKPLRRVSSRRRKLQAAYAKLRKEFLAKHPKCAVLPYLPATEIHHSRGRNATLLLDTRFFVAVSRPGHAAINALPTYARQEGWLCALGLWNTPPKDAETERLRRYMMELTR